MKFSNKSSEHLDGMKNIGARTRMLPNNLLASLSSLLLARRHQVRYPHSPWQHSMDAMRTPTGLARQYLPKGIDLYVFSQVELDGIAWNLNTRPRKSLGFKYPVELFMPDAFGFKLHHAALFALAA